MDRLKEVKELLTAFSNLHLNEELLRYAFNLCDILEQEQGISNSRSKTKIWAAAIIYVIARLNFLYDKENENFLTTDDICNFFGTKKSTASNKASVIEKDYDICFGEEGLCSPEISDALTYIELPTGFIIPLNIVKGEEYKKRQEEKQRIREQKYLEKKQQLKEQRDKKKQEEKQEAEKNQLSLFDDL